MTNLIIANASPVVQAQVQATQDNNAVQAGESFGSVLARQRASQEPADGASAASADAASASAGSISSEADDAGSLQDLKKQDIAGLMLDGLLPATDRGLATVKEGDDLKASASDEAALLSGGILAALAPAVLSGQGVTAPEAETGGKSSEMQSVLPSLTGARGYGATASSDIGTGATRNEIFQAALEVSGKNSSSPVQLLDGMQTTLQSVQNDAPALAGLGQNGVAVLAPNTSVAAQSQLNSHLTSNAWGEEFSQKIVWMATQREQTAELHLNPPNLGPLEVVISVSDDQATALFASQHAAVRNAVEQALPKLREMLADSGITLGNATVSDQLPRERQAGYDSKQQNGEGLVARANEPVLAVSQPNLVSWTRRRHEGMVDTFA